MNAREYFFYVLGRRHKVPLLKDQGGRVYVSQGREPVPVSLQWLGQTAAELKIGTQRFLFHAEKDPEELSLVHRGDLLRIRKFAGDNAKASAAGKPSQVFLIQSPIPGLVASVLVRRHQKVEQGEILLVIEAMKMQNPVRAPGTGKIKKIFVQRGTFVESAAGLIEMEGWKR